MSAALNDVRELVDHLNGLMDSLEESVSHDQVYEQLRVAWTMARTIRTALSTPPADDVREALTKRLADEIEYRVRTAVALAKGGHSIAAQVTDGRASVPVILAQFEVRP